MCLPKFDTNTLQQNLQAWVNIGASETVVSWIKEGLHIPFHKAPPSFHLNNPKLSEKQSKFVDTELQSLLKNGNIKESRTVPYCVSPIKVVPKKNKKFRLVTNLHHLNEHVNAPIFKSVNKTDVTTVIKLKVFIMLPCIKLLKM